MLKYWSLRLHRWLTFIFSIPLALIIITGLLISIEPYLYQSNSINSPLTKEKLTAIQKEFDPEKKARSISFRSYTNELTLVGVGEDGETLIDAKTGEELENDSKTVEFFRTNRSLHQSLLIDESRLLVTISTFVMLALIVLGLLMGLPRLKNSLSGWHKGLAWFLLPLFITSPLTGIFLAYRVTFNPPPQRSAIPQPPMSLWNGLEKVLEKHEPSAIIWVRPQGGALAARLVDEKQIKTFRVTPEGLLATGANWPRAIHEGTWHTTLASFLNILLSFVFTFMMISGIWIWARRKFRKKQRVREQQTA